MALTTPTPENTSLAAAPSTNGLVAFSMNGLWCTDSGLSYDNGTGALTATSFVGALTGNAITVTVADTTDTSSFVALFESATGNLAPVTDASLTYNAGTGVLRAAGGMAVGGALPTNPQSIFSVISSAVTATANQSYYIGTIAPAAAVTIPTGTAAIVASLAIAEPNITATGTVTVGCTLYIKDAPTEGSTNHALWVDAGTTRLDGNLTVAAAAWDLIGIANTAAAIEITDGTTALVAIDTRNTVSVQNIILTGPASQTLPDGATSRARIVSIPSRTITLAGTTQVTTENLGVQMFIDAPTIAQSGGAVTMDRVSSLHVGTPVAGSSVTLTNNHIISTGTAGCFCTAAGVWTDTSGRAAKENIVDADLEDAIAVIDDVQIKRFRYKDASDGFITRFGGIAEDVPEELSMPGRLGIAARDVAWTSMAGVKFLRQENADLRRRLEALEAKLN